MEFTQKELIYRAFNPLATAAGLDIYVLSYDDMYGWNMLAKSLRKEIGVEPESVEDMRRNYMDEGGYGVIVKSKTYHGGSEIANMFRKLRVTTGDVQHMMSVNAKKNPIWGDLAASNHLHLYFIPVSVN